MGTQLHCSSLSSWLRSFHYSISHKSLLICWVSVSIVKPLRFKISRNSVAHSSCLWGKLVSETIKLYSSIASGSHPTMFYWNQAFTSYIALEKISCRNPVKEFSKIEMWPELRKPSSRWKTDFKTDSFWPNQKFRSGSQVVHVLRKKVG